VACRMMTKLECHLIGCELVTGDNKPGLVCTVCTCTYRTDLRRPSCLLSGVKCPTASTTHLAVPSLTRGAVFKHHEQIHHSIRKPQTVSRDSQHHIAGAIRAESTEYYRSKQQATLSLILSQHAHNESLNVISILFLGNHSLAGKNCRH
jgi:hypothetical protein